jgi:hypothetical protein
MSTTYKDPYEVDYYSTPVKKPESNQTTNIFNPSNAQTNVQKEEELPNFVDLTKNAYASNTGAYEGEEEIPILEGN